MIGDFYIFPLEMNTNRLNREDYTFKPVPLRNIMDKHMCSLMLTQGSKHISLCHHTYNDKQIVAIVENSEYFLFYHKKGLIEEIVAFSLVKFRNKGLDILLLCALPNSNEFGRMMAYSTYKFANEKKCMKICAAPRNDALRHTFLRYGFKPGFGTKDVDEVLEKDIVLPKYSKRNCTFKLSRSGKNETAGTEDLIEHNGS